MAKPNALQIGLSGLAVALIVGVIVWVANWDPWGSKRRLKARAESAELQVVIDQGATTALDNYTRQAAQTAEKTHVIIRKVERTPGAETPLPDSLRAELCNGLGQLRQRPACADDPGSEQPPY